MYISSISQPGCLCPSAPVNGYTSSCSVYLTYDNYVHYYCDSGYQLYGNNSRLCLSSKMWSGSAPICVKSKLKVYYVQLDM